MKWWQMVLGSSDFAQLIDAFANVVALEEGGNVHEQIIQSGCESNVFVG